MHCRHLQLRKSTGYKRPDDPLGLARAREAYKDGTPGMLVPPSCPKTFSDISSAFTRKLI